MSWKTYQFDELTTEELYDFLKLRVDVFVVEQNCPYPELDGLDQQAIHIAYGENGKTLAYARLVPAGVKYEAPSIGRVIVHPEARNRGLARRLLHQCIDFIQTHWKAEEIQLQGQVYLQQFYESVGFQTVSDIYEEDGIPHVDMKLHSKQLQD
ncbi:GNAT family N-acetyltransferase [Planococcus salinus]|uniref:GNAT family N-acetyltransferase n=1 Tax=Planococcus salinus TaxID=1848460 RepID=A0A3M8P4J0_9BACL|nr:GNAT family N-acetyltransferase [Planococcus salinus]RNF38542.1 GNAT family N-acetyltransferase [Planococcus salinus]